MKRSITALVAVFTLAVTACTAEDATTDTGPVPISVGGEGIFAAGAEVEPFDSCTDFLDYVKRHATELVGPYGLPGYGFGWFGDDVFVEVADELRGSEQVAPTTTAAASGGVEGVDYSGTNVQVAGVDEPDLVKTDGERIFVVAQGKLHWVDATGTPRIVATLPLDGWGHQLFLSDGRLLVMTSGGGGYIEPLGRGFAEDGVAYESPRTMLQEIDVTDPDDMRVLRTMTMDGTMLSSRMVDESVRLVVRSGPIGFNWSYPEGSGLKAEREAVDRNKRLIEDSTLENWVPWYVLEDHQSGVTSDGPLLGCDQVGHPAEFSGLSMLSVLTLDIGRALEPGGGIGLLAEGETIYASPTSLYVATGPWMVQTWVAPEREDIPDTLTTQIHKFDISDPSSASYVASGEVEGVLMSQWGMDEYQGVLRVVVTDEDPWWGSDEAPETSVITLEHVGETLVEIGSVGGLGKNEHVYAVRFIRDRGYVVTFRQVDPLYVIDLSDPTDPTVEGELKINGYSAYLHPIGEHLLLGVGQNATDEGRVLGTQVSVFDVSDPTDPRRLARMTFDDSNSQAEWDHHAFLWWPQDGIAVMPLQRWSWDEEAGSEDFFAGATVVSATPQRLKQVAEIQHPTEREAECPECGWWTAPIMRSLVIGDVLYTVSDTGMLASDMETYEQVEWIKF